MSTERLRQLRREYEAGGLEALRPGKHGGPRRLSEREVARRWRTFEKGLSPTAAHATMKDVSLLTVRRAHQASRRTREEARSERGRARLGGVADDDPPRHRDAADAARPWDRAGRRGRVRQKTSKAAANGE